MVDRQQILRKIYIGCSSYPFAQQGHSQAWHLVGEIETGIERTRRLVPGSDVPEIPDAHISRARGRVTMAAYIVSPCLKHA